MADRAKLIGNALATWAPDYPRRVGRKQLWSENHHGTVQQLLDEETKDGGSPFISVYSFPRGHTKEDEIPRINTLFIDFDFDNGEYESGSGDREAWQRDMSHLLVRARRVAELINRSDRSESWRASLSGHKGIHLFLDFPAIDENLGSFDNYVAGMNDYADALVEQLSDETGLDSLSKYVDVTSGDLGRLCRVPNTLHSGATDSFGEDRYCVPVTMEELESMTPSMYEELSAAPREVPWESRNESVEAGEIIEQHVRTASPTSRKYGSTAEHSTIVDWSRVPEYEERSNGNLTLEDARFLTSDRPCVWEFHEREDKFQYGNQSHVMESHCIAVLLQNNFPIDVIKRFLSTSPNYDEKYTEDRIRELIARDFNPYSTRKLLRQAPEFTGYDWCSRCQNVIESDDELQRIHNS